MPSNLPSSGSELDPSINSRSHFLIQENITSDTITSPLKKQQRYQPPTPQQPPSNNGSPPLQDNNNKNEDNNKQLFEPTPSLNESPKPIDPVGPAVTSSQYEIEPQWSSVQPTASPNRASPNRGSPNRNTDSEFGFERQTSSVFASLRRGSSSRTNRGKSRRDYQFHNLLGEGALGKVYRATKIDSHTTPPEEVAIKVVKKSRVLHSPVLCQMVREEVRIHSKPEIIKNPYIVTLKSSFQDEGFLYYVFEYVDGNTLGKTIERLAQFRDCPIVPIELVRLWTAELLYVVWTLGKEKIVHRDLKPENIILADGHMRVLDFNNALIVTDLSPESVYTGGFTNKFFASSNRNSSFPASPLATETIEPDFSMIRKRSALSNPLVFGQDGIDYSISASRGKLSNDITFTAPFEVSSTDSGIADSSPTPAAGGGGFDPMVDFGGTLPYWAPERVSLYVNGAGSVKSLISLSSNSDVPIRRSVTSGKNSTSSNNNSSCIGIEFDIWSVGCLMFEMMTGVNPFLRATPELTADAILRYSTGTVGLHFPPNIGHLAQDLCRKLLDPQAAKRSSLLSGDYETVLAHPFFAGFSFKTPLVGIDPTNLIESIWKNSIKNNPKDDSGSNFPPISSSWLEFTPEPGKAFSGHESYSSLLNSPMHLPSNSTTMPAIFPLQNDSEIIPVTTSYNNTVINNKSSVRATIRSSPRQSPRQQQNLNINDVQNITSPVNDVTSSESELQSRSCSSVGPTINVSNQSNNTNNNKSTPKIPFETSPKEAEVKFADREDQILNNHNREGKGITTTTNRTIEPIFSSKAQGASVPLYRTSFADASTAASQRPTIGGLGLDEQGKIKHETDDFSVPNKNVSASTPQPNVRQEDTMNADLLSNAENWLAIMVSEKYREFMINEVVEGLQCILREQMTPEEYDKIDSQGMEFVKAADVLTWGPIRITFVKSPTRSIQRPPLSISPQQKFYIPDNQIDHIATSDQIVLRQGAQNSFQRSFSTGSNFLCCIRSPSYLLYNRVKRWLTPIQTPTDGNIFDSTSSNDSSPRSICPDHAQVTYQQQRLHQYPNYPSRQITSPYGESPTPPRPEITTTTATSIMRNSTDMRLLPRPSSQRQSNTANNNNGPTTTTGYGVLSAKFGLLMFEVDLVQETSTFKYMIEIQKNAFQIQKVSPNEMSDLIIQELGGEHAFRGRYELIQITFNNPLTVRNRENHEKFNTQKILIDVGDASNLNYWYPHLHSFLHMNTP